VVADLDAAQRGGPARHVVTGAVARHEIVRTFHSTCMVGGYDRTVDALADLVGLRVLECSESELVGRKGGMTWIGDGSLEVAQPIVADHANQRFLDRFGPGMHSLAFQVTDLDATLERLAGVGVAVGVRPADWFCFTDPRTTGGLLFEWSARTVPEDPRAGAAAPAFVVEPVLAVDTIAFVGAVVADPIAWAETFAEPFGLTETFRRSSAPPGQPVVGLAAPDAMVALFALPGDASGALWGAHHERARFHALGVGVADLDAAIAALTAARVDVLWRDDELAVVDPAAAGDVCLVLVGGRLTGDPRQSTTTARA